MLFWSLKCMSVLTQPYLNVCMHTSVEMLPGYVMYFIYIYIFHVHAVELVLYVIKAIDSLIELFTNIIIIYE